MTLTNVIAKGKFSKSDLALLEKVYEKADLVAPKNEEQSISVCFWCKLLANQDPQL